jgi:hypothetical protein
MYGVTRKATIIPVAVPPQVHRTFETYRREP